MLVWSMLWPDVYTSITSCFLSKQLNGSLWFLGQRFPWAYPTLFKEIRVSLIITVLPLITKLLDFLLEEANHNLMKNRSYTEVKQESQDRAGQRAGTS